jgi:hypothetical protein
MTGVLFAGQVLHLGPNSRGLGTHIHEFPIRNQDACQNERVRHYVGHPPFIDCHPDPAKREKDLPQKLKSYTRCPGFLPRVLAEKPGERD